MNELNVFDEKAIDLLHSMFEMNPKKRIKIDEVIYHPYLTDSNDPPCRAKDLPNFTVYPDTKPN